MTQAAPPNQPYTAPAGTLHELEARLLETPHDARQLFEVRRLAIDQELSV
jgi:hypothetical protein